MEKKHGQRCRPVRRGRRPRSSGRTWSWASESPDNEGLPGRRPRCSRLRRVVAGLFRGRAGIYAAPLRGGGRPDEIVLLRDIRLSRRAASFAPIIGRVHIGYLPRKRVMGISKLARLVDVYAKRMQVQEKMTAEIASCLNAVL